MKPLPFYIPFVFVLTALLTVFLFFRASGYDRKVILFLGLAMLAQSVLAASGFFTKTNILPPRLLLLLVSSILVICILFSTTRGKAFVDGIDIRKLGLIHCIRIAVELVLLWLFLQGTMPRLMTFEGRNYDLLSGLSAPLVYYFGLVKGKWSPGVLLGWNIACFCILCFTVVNAVLSAPTPLQQFGFDQPTIAVLYFPFIWLPGILVPLVLFAHLVAIRHYWRSAFQRRVGTVA